MLVAVVCILVAMPSSVAAEVVPYLGASARYSAYQMNDVNDEIRAFSESFDGISGGLGYGVEFGLRFSDDLLLSLHYERILATSEMSGAGYSSAYDLPANAFFASGTVLKPVSNALHLGLSGGVGLVACGGSADWYVADIGSLAVEMSGRGLLVQATVSLDVPIAEQFHFSPYVGYRHARVASVDVDGRSWIASSGDDYSIDYSGVLAGVTFAMYFGKS